MRIGAVVAVALIASCTWNVPGLPGGKAADQLACEEAVARLESCCGSAMTVEPSCVYAFRSPATLRDCNLDEPHIDENEAVCILAASCDDLVRLEVCSTIDNAVHWDDLERSCAK